MRSNRINRAWIALRRLSLKRFSFSILTLLLVLVVADVALNIAFRDIRVAWLGELYRVPPDGSQPGWELRPGARIEYSGMSGEASAYSVIQINSLGMRDRERSMAKQPGAFRIVCVGDSHTMGLGVEREEAFPARLEHEFALAGHPEVEVWNAGVAGYNMFDYPPYLEKRILPLKPDLIVLQVCGNDAQRISLIEAGYFKQTLNLVRYSGLIKLVTVLSKARDDLDTFKSRLGRFIQACREAQVPLVIWPHSWPTDLEGWAVSLCQRSAVTVLDLDKFRPQTLPNDPHYTAQANAELARIVYPQLIVQLDQASGLDQGAPLSAK
ncbi:MAG: SGNH/GDSL hydrolase family protein [Candidatus Alcyoniella australis]|nr:SGNH/GDSL hydrolase family protein [Candidatus Alcyoniella australis]